MLTICWSVVMYTPYIAYLWDINVCHIFYTYFFNTFLSNLRGSTPWETIQTQILEMTSSVNHQSASVFGTRDMLCAYLLTGYLITIAFDMFSYKSPSQPFFSWCCFGISDLASANCVCMFVNCHWMKMQCYCEQVVSWLEETYHSLLFQIR